MNWVDFNSTIINTGFLLTPIYIAIVAVTGDGFWPVSLIRQTARRLSNSGAPGEVAGARQPSHAIHEQTGFVLSFAGLMLTLFLSGLVYHWAFKMPSQNAVGTGFAFVVVPLGYFFAFASMTFFAALTGLMTLIAVNQMTAWISNSPKRNKK